MYIPPAHRNDLRIPSILPATPPLPPPPEEEEPLPLELPSPPPPPEEERRSGRSDMALTNPLGGCNDDDDNDDDVERHN